MPPPGTAELCLDVTTDGTTLLIAPVIKTGDSADAVPLRFIGSEGHGVIYADRAQAATASSPGSGSPGSPIRSPRSCSTSRSRTSGSSSRKPSRPRSFPSTTRGCAARPP